MAATMTEEKLRVRLKIDSRLEFALTILLAAAGCRIDGVELVEWDCWEVVASCPLQKDGKEMIRSAVESLEKTGIIASLPVWAEA